MGQAFGDAFMSGFRVALLVAGAVLLLAALVANRFIPGREAVREGRSPADVPVAVEA